MLVAMRPATDVTFTTRPCAWISAGRTALNTARVVMLSVDAHACCSRRAITHCARRPSS